MLTYQPQCDPYNEIFRILSLLYFDKNKQFNLDVLKILDFYFLFPQFITDIKLPKEMVSYRSRFKKYENIYAVQDTKKQLFDNLDVYQCMAIDTLVAKKIINTKYYQKNIVFLNEQIDIAPYLDQQLEQRNSDNQELLDFLVNKLSSIHFLGENGLKARTGLMEYRYDDITF